MNEEIRQAIADAKEQQPVAIDIGWYQGTVELDDIKQYIRANINSASRSFVAIGYYLKYVRDNELYIEDDYSGISEFAKAEFGISPAQASKFISINDRFSVDGNSPILLEQYKDFTSSKLSEMLYLTDEQLEQVSIASTKAEIRQIGKPVKEEVETISFSPAKTEPDLYAAKKPYVGTIIYSVGGCGKITKLEVISKDSSFSPEYFDAKDNLGQIYYLSCKSEHWHLTRDEAKNDPWYDKKNDKPRLKQIETESETAETVEVVLDEDDPCKTCGHCNVGCCDYPETEDDYCIMGDKWVPQKEETVDVVEAEIVTNQPQQPDLPLLKNNDQRKEFIDAYDTWPVWIETKDTGERYYRYDFDNGDSIVVKVYYCKLFNYKATNLDYDDRFSDGWGKEEYYLLETGKYFKDCETNKSSLIEYLKDLQKKGV